MMGGESRKSWRTYMKVLLVVGILALVLVGVVVLIGYLLPVKHVASVSAQFSEAPDTIWKAIRDIQAFPSWRKDVKSVQVISGVDSRHEWREEGKNGDISYQIVEAQEPSRLVSKIADQN